MAKSTIKLPDGTYITIDGKPEEIKNILSLYTDKKNKGKASSAHIDSISSTKLKKRGKNAVNDDMEEDLVVDIVNIIKDCEESDKIEENILDRLSQIDRILLPLYIANKHKGPKTRLTSGDIAKILSELGVPIKVPNVSAKLATSASKYVMQNASRKRGQSTKYTISRRGIQYISSVINGS